jgi:transposase
MQGNGKKTSTAVREPAGEGLPVVRPNVAAIDLASEVHWVCAPSLDGTGREVEQFGATTPELERMATWLKDRKVESVAMESTGVYWIAPHEVLERHGLEILLTNWRACQGGRSRTT